METYSIIPHLDMDKGQKDSMDVRQDLFTGDEEHH
jgi:hypothetical protein